MFKNATIFRIVSGAASVADAIDALENHAFVACQPTQQQSSGWIPPRGRNHGSLIETVAGQVILKLMIETKSVPADVVQRKVDETVAWIEVEEGRTPGKKGRREIKEDALMSLLPLAFPKRSSVLAWIDPVNKLLVIDSTSQSRCDEVIFMLIKCVDGLVVQMINTTNSADGSMASWLLEKEGPAHFTIDRECELKARDESKAVVKYGRHPLDIDEVGEHIKQGKMPTKLAMTWNDRVSLVLTEGMTLKKIELLEAALIGDKGMTLEDDAFDADVTIATGELSGVIKDLIDALGGEVVPD